MIDTFNKLQDAEEKPRLAKDETKRAEAEYHRVIGHNLSD